MVKVLDTAMAIHYKTPSALLLSLCFALNPTRYNRIDSQAVMCRCSSPVEVSLLITSLFCSFQEQLRQMGHHTACLWASGACHRHRPLRG